MDEIKKLELEIVNLKSKIRRCYYRDAFHDASKFEYELDVAETKLKEIQDL